MIAMPTRPGPKPVLTAAPRQSSDCRSYSPLEAAPARRGIFPSSTGNAVFQASPAKHRSITAMHDIAIRFEPYEIVMHEMTKFEYLCHAGRAILDAAGRRNRCT